MNFVCHSEQCLPLLNCNVVDQDCTDDDRSRCGVVILPNGGVSATCLEPADDPDSLGEPCTFVEGEDSCEPGTACISTPELSCIALCETSAECAADEACNSIFGPPQDTGDVCAENGTYENQLCDEGCPLPDPECALLPLPPFGICTPPPPAQALGESCADPAAFVLPAAGTTTTFTVDLTGRGSDLEGSCRSVGGTDGSNGIDGVLSTTAAVNGTVAVATSGRDTVVYAFDGACPGTEVACDDDGGGAGAGSVISFAVVAGQSYFVVIDLFGSTPAGAVTVTVGLTQ